jgi:hypothetical protein
VKDIKDALIKITDTVSGWKEDILYVREMRELKNKLKVNVISQWIVALASLLLWSYTMFGVKK